MDPEVKVLFIIFRVDLNLATMCRIRIPRARRQGHNGRWSNFTNKVKKEPSVPLFDDPATLRLAEPADGEVWFMVFSE